MEQKTEFMLVFRFEPNFDHQPTAAELGEMQQQWGAFIGNLAIQEKLVSTHQLSFDGKQIFADRTITTGINSTNKQIVGGNMIVKASNLDEAVEIGKHCPILDMGGSVEVRTIQPM